MNTRILPEKDSVDTIYERLERYILPVDPEWSKRLKPAKRENVDKVYSISKMEEAGFHFPASYIEYLKYMGEDDGNFLSYGIYANTDLTTIILDYEGKEEDPFDLIEPNHYVFAFNTEVGVEYYITTKENGKQIITSGNDERYGMEYYSENFEKLLFQIAYDIHERRYFEHQYYFGTNRIKLDITLKKLGVEIEDIFSVVDEVVHKYGFNKVWFSDDYHYIAIKDNLSFWLRRDMAISGYVLGNDEKQVEKYGNILNQLLGTRKQ